MNVEDNIVKKWIHFIEHLFRTSKPMLTITTLVWKAIGLKVYNIPIFSAIFDSNEISNNIWFEKRIIKQKV